MAKFSKSKIIVYFPTKMVKWSIIGPNFFDKVDMLHAKIYYN
jgi:hypothetical protein